MTEKTYKAHITCSQEDKKLLMKDCVKLFLNENPSFEGMTLSQGFMIKKVVEFYLKDV